MDKDEIIELLESLRLPEEPQVRKEEGIYEGQAITNEWASQVDWVKKTDNFDFNTINEIVENIGKSGNEKKIVIKAIFDAMWKTGEVSKIPYSVDKLLNNLYKKYDENDKGLLSSITTNELNPDLISLSKKRMDEFIADKQNNNESSSDNSGTFLQQIEDLKVQVEELKQENASLKEQAEEKNVEEDNNGEGFTNAQMCALIYSMACFSEEKVTKTKLADIVAAIRGSGKSSSTTLLKGKWKRIDFITVSEIIREQMPKLAEKIIQLAPKE